MSAREETIIAIGNRRELMISTRKYHSGGLISDATVSQLSEDGKFRTHAIGLGIPGVGDFSVRIFRDTTKRCTDKNVREMHAAALLQRDELTARAITYYTAKDAKKEV